MIQKIYLKVQLMFKLIESYFLNSEIKIKIQLYILPIFVIYFYFYFMDNKINSIHLNTTNSLGLSSLISKKFDGSYLKLVKDIESFCISSKIKINTIDYKKNNLLIKGKTTLKKINKLIIKLENLNNFSKLNSLDIQKTSKQNQFTFEITTEFKKYYIKAKKVIEKKVKKISRIQFNLKAIVSNHILLNSKWYTLNDTVGKYKIIRIEKNLVFLKYKDKTKKLRLNKNE